LRYRGHFITHRSACSLPLTRIQRHGALNRDLIMTRTHGLGGPCYGVLAFLIRCSSVELPATPEDCSMPGAPRSPLARPASSALARPLTWGYRRNSGGRQKLSPTGFPTRSEGFFQCRAIVPNGSARRASGGVLRLFGFSPEGDTSLPVCVSHRNLATTQPFFILQLRQHPFQLLRM
jgi:hypothetical protein